MDRAVPVGTRRPGRWLAMVMCAGLLIAATGCAGGRQPGRLDTGSAATALDPGNVGMSCATPDPAGTAPETPPPTGPSPSPEPLPRDFTPVSAGRCVLRMVTVPGDGEWQVHEEQEATSGLDALTRALRRPSESGDATVACPAIGMLPVVITLTDAHGTTTSPAIPHDACNFPLRTVLDAIQALPWTTVRETRIRQIRSQLEVESGCPGGYKPVIDLEATESARRPAGSGPFFPGTPPAALRVCRYALDATSTVPGFNGSGMFRMGTLSTATRLTGPDLRRLLAGLDAATAVTGPCDKPQVPFAVLSPDGGSGPWATVELGGCNRALDGDEGLRQLDAATVAILAG